MGISPWAYAFLFRGISSPLHPVISFYAAAFSANLSQHPNHCFQCSPESRRLGHVAKFCYGMVDGARRLHNQLLVLQWPLHSLLGDRQEEVWLMEALRRGWMKEKKSNKFDQPALELLTLALALSGIT